MKLAWLTDIHLNFLEHEAVEAFFGTVAETPCDGILLSGDIGEAPDVAYYLQAVDTAVQKPIYFVLGNHDFYRGGIASVRSLAASVCDDRPNLHYLPNAGVIELTKKTCLIGADGWGDGRYGDYWGLKVDLNDWALIGEFKRLDDRARLAKLNQLGIDRRSNHTWKPAAVRLRCRRATNDAAGSNGSPSSPRA
jgi:hypothetical protein